ncbi:hypothetical protein ACP4OV_022943 [Aristida adscensionis]
MFLPEAWTLRRRAGLAMASAAAPALPDELLEEIFVRLDDAADLARAACACASFRSIATARRFPRRFRSLHPPPVLGFLTPGLPGEFHPADPPHRSAPAARAVARAAGFDFSFLPVPDPRWWCVRDARDGRVLLHRHVGTAAVFEQLVACDPLHRRYVEIPPIPGALALSTGGWASNQFEPLLVPASKGEEEDLSLGVICVVRKECKLVTLRFSSASPTGGWHVVTFQRPMPYCLTPLSAAMQMDASTGCPFLP